MSIKLPESWSTDSQVRGLRIELAEQHSLVLPFDQFLLSELVAEGREHRLRLLFAMHEVLITGHNLKRLQVAIQKQELSSVSKASPNYEKPFADGPPLIQDIVVTEMKPLAKQPPQ